MAVLGSRKNVTSTCSFIQQALIVSDVKEGVAWFTALGNSSSLVRE